VAAVRGRNHALVPAALGAYVAYLAHAGIDWDWEMPAVTLAGLFCACALLVAARGRSSLVALGAAARVGLLAATLVLSAAAFAGLAGSHAIEASEDAERNGELVRAEADARTAIRWAPWSSAGWDRLAQVHFARDDLGGAREALLEAVEKSPGDWGLWFDLGAASEGAEQLGAYREAARLNPRSANVAALRTLGVLPPLEEDGS
jgi:cytochrome c-type biogenesis protein CcmH/NrfG